MYIFYLVYILLACVLRIPSALLPIGTICFAYLSVFSYQSPHQSPLQGPRPFCRAATRRKTIRSDGRESIYERKAESRPKKEGSAPKCRACVIDEKPSSKDGDKPELLCLEGRRSSRCRDGLRRPFTLSLMPAAAIVGAGCVAATAGLRRRSDGLDRNARVRHRQMFDCRGRGPKSAHLFHPIAPMLCTSQTLQNDSDV